MIDRLKKKKIPSNIEMLYMEIVESNKTTLKICKSKPPNWQR